MWSKNVLPSTIKKDLLEARSCRFSTLSTEWSLDDYWKIFCEQAKGNDFSAREKSLSGWERHSGSHFHLAACSLTVASLLRLFFAASRGNEWASRRRETRGRLVTRLNIIEQTIFLSRFFFVYTRESHLWCVSFIAHKKRRRLKTQKTTRTRAIKFTSFFNIKLLIFAR